MKNEQVKDVTTSYLVNLAERLEIKSSDFYIRLASMFTDRSEIFQSFAKRSEQNRKIIIRTYRETISDALEAGFSFSGFDPSRFEVETRLDENITERKAFETALLIEDKASTFYFNAAEACGLLLATITRTLRRVGEIRKDRKNKISLILSQLVKK